ncbi:MAG: retroviral-like aspartic protease family protein [Cytophagales bacterium]|nr:retroviral-like aspartic protease family protein [Cytophagales bacterium]
MGLVYATIDLINAEDKALAKNGYIKETSIRKLPVRMMVDSGAVMMAINEEIKTQLGLTAKDKQIFTLANGTVIKLEKAAGIEVNFKNRWCTTDAVVLKGNTEPLFGALPI